MTDEGTVRTESDALWTPQDTARYLRASVSWVYHAAQRGDLPCLRISRMLRFDPAAIRTFALAKASRPATATQVSAQGRR